MTTQYPYRSEETIFGDSGSISAAWDGGYHVYGGAARYKRYKTWKAAWKAFCGFNNYPLDILPKC